MLGIGKEYKQLLYYATISEKVSFDKLQFNSYKICFTFGITDGLKKDGSIKIKRHDYDGFIKLAQDSICDALGIDDSLIIDADIKKRFDGNYVKCSVYGLYSSFNNGSIP